MPSGSCIGKSVRLIGVFFSVGLHWIKNSTVLVAILSDVQCMRKVQRVIWPRYLKSDATNRLRCNAKQKLLLAKDGFYIERDMRAFLMFSCVRFYVYHAE